MSQQNSGSTPSTTMENIKKNLPAIGLAVLATGLAIYGIKKYNESSQTEMVEQQPKVAVKPKAKAKEEPPKKKPLGDLQINLDLSQAMKIKELNDWLKQYIAEVLLKGGSLKAQSGYLEKEPFVKIFNLIELASKVHLSPLRNNQEVERASQTDQTMDKYVQLVLDQTNDQMDDFLKCTETLLKDSGVNMDVYNESIETHLPDGIENMKKTVQASFTSPFVVDQTDLMPKDQVKATFMSVLDSAYFKLAGKDFDNLIGTNKTIEDEGDLLLVFDCIMSDLFKSQSKVSSEKFKAQVSQHGLLSNDKECQDKIEQTITKVHALIQS